MPKNTGRDPWKSEETGLADDFDGYIVNSYFGTDSRYSEKAEGYTPTLLIFEVESPDPDVGEQTIIWSVGKGFVPMEGGKLAKHETKGFDATFNRSTLVRKFINRVMEFPGVEDILRQKDNEYGQLNAHVWIGMGFHWNSENISFGKNIDDRTHLMPTRFIGMHKEGQAPAAAPAPSAPAPAASAPAVDISAAKLKAELIKLAKASDSYATFSTAAFAMPEVVENDAFLTAVSDESENGFWAKYGPK